ncbi:hypothetical protein FQN57_000465 [Myotisia sp. PD_48]|nr:hypothetical protein FQN57_000465 [Myotisia sp. PD_48]
MDLRVGKSMLPRLELEIHVDDPCTTGDFIRVMGLKIVGSSRSAPPAMSTMLRTLVIYALARSYVSSGPRLTNVGQSGNIRRGSSRDICTAQGHCSPDSSSIEAAR